MSAVAVPDSAAPRAVPEDLFGHPKGLYVCFFTEMWERFSFYGMKALLLVYLVKHHLFADKDGYVLVGAYGGMVYAVPLIGGMLADRYLGMRKAVVLGGVLLCLGHLGMAYEGHAATLVNGVVQRDTGGLMAFYFSLALIVSGVGFLKPNISTVVGKLYAENDPRRDSGFTVFYAGINVGALFGSIVCGFLGEMYGWGWGFGAAGIGMLAGLAMFITGQKHLMGHAEPPDPKRLKQRVFGPLNVETAIYAGTVLAIVAIWGLFQLPESIAWAQFGMLVLWLGWLAWFLNARCTPVQRQQMYALLFFIAACLVFFTLYEQTYGSWILFTDRMLTKDLFPSLVIAQGKPWPWSIVPLILSPLAVGIALRLQDKRAASLLVGAVALLGAVLVTRDCVVLPQTASSLTYLGAICIVILSPLFAWLWPALEKRNLNPSKPFKSAIGLAVAGLAFLPLVAANASVAPGQLGSVWWLVLAYLVLEVGEVCLSPIGLSAVTQLSVSSVVAVMMGAWFLATSFSEQLAAQLGKLASLEIVEGQAIDFADATAKYGSLFQHLVWIGLGAGLLALLATPRVLRWMHGVK